MVIFGGKMSKTAESKDEKNGSKKAEKTVIKTTEKPSVKFKIIGYGKTNC